MAVLTKNEILQVNDLQELKELEVEEWGGSIFIGKMNLIDKFRYEERFKLDDNGTPVAMDPHDPNTVLEYLVLTIKDANGSPMFDLSDMKALASKSAGVLMKIFKECTEFNNVDVEDVKKKSEQTNGESLSID